VAMSGGIDSSFTAYLLRESGYNVVGITFQLMPERLRSTKNPRTCCSHETIARARNMADALSIPHYVLNLRKEFEEHVIQRFVDEYKAGRTPNPCILCNRHIKFSHFLHKALSMGADYVATGHYALTAFDEGRWYLYKGKDLTKDQSYFLYPVEQAVLPHVLFPVGHYRKDDVRTRMTRLGFAPRDARESQDLCFVPDGNYRDFVRPFLSVKPGPVYLTDGTLLGRHDGIHRYTIGQRRGINIPYQVPLYVLDIRPAENTLIVGPKTALEKRSVMVEEANLFDVPRQPVTAKTRFRQKEAPCTFVPSGNTLEVTFLRPIDAAAPGQALVLYDGDRVIGGGVIRESRP